MHNQLDALPFKRGQFFRANNYLEAVGIMTALRSGVALDSVIRPIPSTQVLTQPAQPGFDLLSNQTTDNQCTKQNPV
jgi:hypothetical protein